MAKKFKPPFGDDDRRELVARAAKTGSDLCDARSIVIVIGIAVLVFALFGGRGAGAFTLFVIILIGAGLMEGLGRILQIQAVRLEKDLGPSETPEAE
ncbi:hypothetical protein [Salininema proteolyticum]|uniref:Uncharacterized protein n=1 Tax=Salininema proteolyticum TaxID=1607685 RepID=A0ABV8U2R2_9ACTN